MCIINKYLGLFSW